MGFISNSNGGNSNCLQNFDGQDLLESDHLEDQKLIGRMILKSGGV
jgi:hypothetical protein